MKEGLGRTKTALFKCLKHIQIKRSWSCLVLLQELEAGEKEELTFLNTELSYDPVIPLLNIYPK